MQRNVQHSTHCAPAHRGRRQRIRMRRYGSADRRRKCSACKSSKQLSPRAHAAKCTTQHALRTCAPRTSPTNPSAAIWQRRQTTEIQPGKVKKEIFTTTLPKVGKVVYCMALRIASKSQARTARDRIMEEHKGGAWPPFVVAYALPSSCAPWSCRSRLGRPGPPCRRDPPFFSRLGRS